MRTTVSIGDALLRRARAEALQRGVTLSQVVEEALRVTLESRSEARTERRRPLITFRGNGTMPGVELSSNASLVERMEGL